MWQILYHTIGMEETGQDAVQDQEEEQPGKVEDSLSSKEVDPESGKKDQQGGPLGVPYATEGGRAGNA
eukprot:6864514-Heterocapsa_arctica.AAC.1